MDDKHIKEFLYDYCLEYAQKRLNNIQTAIRSSLESGNDENKSSAGDKHETGRSMAQLEQEKLSFQFQEAEKLLQLLNSFERGKKSSLISIGTVIQTDHDNYFISIPAGKIIIDNETYYAISAVSPLGVALINANGKQAFIFNGKEYRIKKAF
jgi:hypothetical protein